VEATVEELDLMRPSPPLPASPEQLAVQLPDSHTLSTLLDVEEHIQVLGEIQAGRRHPEQDKLCTHQSGATEGKTWAETILRAED
jgi:hypothetical protein